MGAPLPEFDGKIDDPNHLHGSKTETKQGSGYKGNGTITSTLTWHLTRETIP